MIVVVQLTCTLVPGSIVCCDELLERKSPVFRTCRSMTKLEERVRACGGRGLPKEMHLNISLWTFKREYGSPSSRHARVVFTRRS